jgi:hypothetical protein
MTEIGTCARGGLASHANIARVLVDKGEFQREALKFWADPEP